MENKEDTIAAISTTLGMGGIAIIRISGPCALTIGDAIFHSARGKVSEFSTHTIHYGTIIKESTVLDQVMLVVFHAPHSYTREDIIEIQCHGGLLTAQAILSLCLQCGARLAEPGEFTKRAFLNGRIDLTQAEATMDLISARTCRAQTVAAQALQGSLFRKVESIHKIITQLSIQIETLLDFPEEDVQMQTREELSADLDEIISQVEALLNTADEGQGLRNGVAVAFVGRPNVGKSSLMNALLDRDRCIVTSIPGTTRDAIEELVVIQGVPVRLTDTAGYRNASGLLESEGVRKTVKVMQEAQVILHVIDVSRPISKLDQKLAILCNSKRVIRVYNKIDLPHRACKPTWIDANKVVPVSAITRQGIDDLKKEIAEMLTFGTTEESALDVAVNMRQADNFRQVLDLLVHAQHVIKSSFDVEIVAQDIRITRDAIARITGKIVSEDVLNGIFSSFCIGK